MDDFFAVTHYSKECNDCRKTTPSVCIDWLPKSLASIAVSSLPQIMAQRKRICHCATKTGRGIVFPGHYPQVTVDQTGITVDTVNCKRQRIPLMEDQTKAKRQSDGSRVEARVKWTGTDLMEQCQSLLRCWYLFTLNGTWDASKWFLLDQQLTKPTSYLLTQPGVSLCLLLALRMGVSRSHGDFSVVSWTAARLRAERSHWKSHLFLL